MELGNLSPEERRAAWSAEYLRFTMQLRAERFAQNRRNEVREIVDERISELQDACACRCHHHAGNSLRSPIFQSLHLMLATLRRLIGLGPDLPEKKLRETALSSRLPNSSLSGGGLNSPSSSGAKAGGASSSTREGGAA